MSGNGIFVDVAEGHVALNDMADQILATIEYTRNYADTMKAELSTAIINLSDVVGTYNPVVSTADTTVPAIDGPAFPTKPTFGDLGLNTNWPDDDIGVPSLEGYGVLDFAYDPPVAPSDADTSFDYTEDTYTSEMWTALYAKVHGDLLAGGTGLTDTVHGVIVAREQEARRSNQDREFRKKLNAVGAQGFNLASGAAAGLMAEHSSDIMVLDQDALNNITIKDFDLATANTNFAVTTGADLEKMLRSTFDELNKRTLEARKAAKDYILAAFKENVSIYLGKWEGVKAKLEALKTKVEAITSKNDGEVKVILGRAEVYKTKIEAITAENTGKVDARKGEIEVYGTEVEAISKQFISLVDEAKLKQEAVRLEITKTIENEKLKLQAFSDKAGLAKDIALGVANISSQGVASALGAINTSMSNSYTGSEGRDESWRHAADLSETHTFEEEA
jgi:hypothetical protein